jgi:UPF0176 protein
MSLPQPVVNIAGYHFVTLYNTRSMQIELSEQCAALKLKGSIVLSQEGINLMLAGTEPSINRFCELLTARAKFKGMVFKRSFSERQPFKKLLVKIKAHLVPGMAEVRPDQGDVTPSLSPRLLKQWYQQGKDFVMIDTRNDYELTYGTFEQAVNLNLTQFGDLPEKLQAMDEAIKNKPVVMFCTGGIRCEKAAPMAKKLGFKEVYQLEGGILAYFQECGGDHYQGDCFVFDDRVALRSDLKNIK